MNLSIAPHSSSIAASSPAATASTMQWLQQLRAVLTENVNYATDYIRTHFAGVRLEKSQGTHMLFVDCSAWCRAHDKTLDDVLAACYEVGVALQDGRSFHGACRLRINLALPLSRVKEALRRLDQYVFNA